MSWLTDCAEHLEDSISGYAVGTSIFYDFLPDSPDAAIAVYDAGGTLTPHGPGCPWAEHRLEVRTRGTTIANARTLAESVRTYLNGKYGGTWNTTTKLMWCRLDSEPHFLYFDQRDRALFLSRYTLQVQQGTYIT